MPVMRVAIIGGGSAGLSMAQQLLQVGPGRFAPVIFECRERVGGLWNYEYPPGPCTVHSSSAPQPRTTGYAEWEGMPVSAMYDGLYTNIASDLMAFRDTPFPPGTPLFPQRAQVLDYLETFARDAGILQYVRLHTEVERVAREAKNPSRWRVSSKSLATGARSDEEFDYVVAASGRCSTPNVPNVVGVEHFRGIKLHSAWYRFPEEFAGKRVLVVGSNSSGGDIARELCGGVKRTYPGSAAWNAACITTVYQSYRHPELPPPMDYDPRSPDSPEWCRRIQVVGAITHITPEGTVMTATGESLCVDVIIWATGFLYCFPYLDHSVEPFKSQPVIPSNGDDHTVVAADACAATVPHNLDDWLLFYRHDNSLCFLGLPNRIVPFPMSQLQSRYVPAYQNCRPHLARKDTQHAACAVLACRK